MQINLDSITRSVTLPSGSSSANTIEIHTGANVGGALYISSSGSDGYAITLETYSGGAWHPISLAIIGGTGTVSDNTITMAAGDTAVAQYSAATKHLRLTITPSATLTADLTVTITAAPMESSVSAGGAGGGGVGGFIL